MPEPVIRFQHVRAIRRRADRVLCVDGIRMWCERNGIDYQQLLDEGIPGERALELGDAFALKALENARQEALANGEE